MLFNSIDFAIFFPVVFILYWYVFNRNLNQRNIFLLAVSYIFYGWWDPKFLLLLAISTVVDYAAGIFLDNTDNKRARKTILIFSLSANLGILGFFKYFNFFLDNLRTAFTFTGQELSWQGFELVLPVGISFYTFQTMSYTIDVYRRRLKPTSDLVAFAAYVSFFPQLVAGPIERAGNLLPQFFTPHGFDFTKAVNGCRQILWGFFKKLVIADNCGVLADNIFNHYSSNPGSVLLLGAFFFSFQIYGDFSGYSDIAIGTARLMGFELMKNFSFPYFSRDIAEFWRRWHISLSTWFRDYVYVPLGGNQGSKGQKIRNIMLVFIISGFWHGASWTFIIWGMLNALLFLPLLVAGKNRVHLDVVDSGRTLPGIGNLVSMVLTFTIVMLLWIVFRAKTTTEALDIFSRIFSQSLFTAASPGPPAMVVTTLMLIVFFVIVEWSGREHNYALEKTFCNSPQWVRWSFYSLILFLTGLYMHRGGSPFIYFQF